VEQHVAAELSAGIGKASFGEECVMSIMWQRGPVSVAAIAEPEDLEWYLRVWRMALGM
jgi:hypothetical protein